MGTTTASSDIDLFIICKRNRLFTARLIVTAVLHALGLRRHHDKIAGRFCLSFFVTDDALDVSSIALSPRDIYLAFWMKTLTPIVDSTVMDSFVRVNEPFLTQYFPDASLASSSAISPKPPSVIARALEGMLSGPLGSFVERKLKNWQLKRARAKAADLDKKASVIISETMLKFHNIDRRRDIQSRFEATSPFFVDDHVAASRR